MRLPGRQPLRRAARRQPAGDASNHRRADAAPLASPFRTAKEQPMRRTLLFLPLLFLPSPAPAAEPALTPIQKEMIAHLDTLRPDLVSMNQDIWEFAELGLQEYRSAARLAGMLK